MTTTTEVKAVPVAPLAPDAVTRVLLESALIVGNRQAFKQRVLDLLDQGKRAFVLDFAVCNYVDSSGAGVLVSISKKIRDAGGSLALVNVNDDLATYFAFAKLDSLFTINPAS